jgi:hypothetical protein
MKTPLLKRNSVEIRTRTGKTRTTHMRGTDARSAAEKTWFVVYERGGRWRNRFERGRSQACFIATRSKACRAPTTTWSSSLAPAGITSAGPPAARAPHRRWSAGFGTPDFRRGNPSARPQRNGASTARSSAMATAGHAGTFGAAVFGSAATRPPT